MPEPIDTARGKYQALLETLPEWTENAADYVQAIGQRHGRDLVLMRATLNADIPSGLLLRTPDADYIVLGRCSSLFYERHVLLHELGHWLLGHLDSGTYGCRKDAEEREAEHFAHLLADKIAQQSQPQRHCGRRGIVAAFGSRRHLQRNCA